MVRSYESSGTLQHSHFARARHTRKPSGQLADHLVLPRAQRIEIHLGLAETDAVLGKMFCLVHDSSDVQKRFRRDAAHIQTDAAERRIPLDQNAVQAEVGGPEGRRITAGTGAQYQHVASHVGCAAVRLGFGSCGNLRRRGRRRRRGGRTRRGRRRYGTLSLEQGDDRPLRDLVPDLDPQLLDDAGVRGRNFHRRFVGLQRDEGGFLGYPVTGFHESFNDVDVLEIADVRYFYFDHLRHAVLTEGCGGCRRGPRPDRS